MAVAKRQKSPRKQNRGRSKEGQRTGVRPSGRTALLPKPNCTGQAQGGEKTYKERRQRALTLSPPHVHAHFLSLSLSPSRAGALFSLRDVPLRLQDGFSCYYLNKLELKH